MLLKKLIPLFLALFAVPVLINAQVTTSSITGIVRDTKESALAVQLLDVCEMSSHWEDDQFDSRAF